MMIVMFCGKPLFQIISDSIFGWTNESNESINETERERERVDRRIISITKLYVRPSRARPFKNLKHGRTKILWSHTIDDDDWIFFYRDERDYFLCVGVVVSSFSLLF